MWKEAKHEAGDPEPSTHLSRSQEDAQMVVKDKQFEILTPEGQEFVITPEEFQVGIEREVCLHSAFIYPCWLLQSHLFLHLFKAR